MNIQVLQPEEISSLYQRCLLQDFPPDELKPLDRILAEFADDHYVCYGLFDQQMLYGYAFFVKHKADFLLDYFAVISSERGKGYGSDFLRLLREDMETAESILVEVEDPEEVSINEDADVLEIRQQREMRVAFYLRNGLIKSNVRAVTFHVQYLLLEMPCERLHTDRELSQIYAAHYQKMLPKMMYEQEIRLL